MPAGLVKILLLRAGIEQNPGPKTIYICPVCQVKLWHNSTSVQCNKCLQWVHCRRLNNCSELKNTKEHDASYTCSSCKNKPTTPLLQSSPPTPPFRTPSPPTSPPQSQPPTPSLPQHQSPPVPPHFNPPPPVSNPPPNYDYEMNILQWNCNGIGNKTTELTSFIHQHDIKVAVLQESKLGIKSTPPNIPNFNLVRKDRPSAQGGGLATYIHKSVQFMKLPEPPPDGHTETLGVKVGDTNIINVYIPPTSSCTAGFKPNITALLPDGDSLVLGDFNAHDPLWHSSIQDTRGADIAEEIGNSAYGVINENQPTRLPSNGQATSPDISLASTSIMTSTEWKTETSLGSDHLPIIIKIGTTIKPSFSDHRNFINFNKANWEKFNNITEEKFQSLPDPTDVHKAEKEFRKIINKAAKRTIPGGRIKEIIPEIPTSTADKIKERDNIRSTNPHSPDIANLNREILHEISNHRQTKWREKVSEVNKNCSSKLFRLIKNLNGHTCDNNNQAIKFKGKYITSAKNIAYAFNKQYTSIVRHQSSKHSRIVTRNIKENTLEDHPTFNHQQTWKAIKAAKASKAAGPDNISNLHLKHLGENGIKYLTKIFNLSIRTSITPDIWKNSIIIPLLKPNKPANESDSYRPVSLLCPAIKILERLLLPTLTEKLEVPVFQHGFRKDHSTVTALNDFNLQVSNGFNEKRSTKPDRTVLLQIDLSKAFDMVNHDKLLADLNQTTLPGSLKRWLCCYLKGRQSKVCFRNKLSKSKNVRAGVPQGAVTSPILFNFYLRHLPSPPEHIKVVQYADDISIYATGKPIQALSESINKYVPRVLEFLEERELKVSPSKSTVTLFTPDTKEFKIIPDVKMKNDAVPHDHKPKLLGVTYDTMFTFSKHVNIIVDKAKTKVNIMKKLAGSTWGQDKDTLSLTYKSIVRSVLEYAAPIWSPIISDSSWQKLQTVQNQALRVITGNHLMAPEHHLHRETKILPIRDHCKMVSKQYLVKSHLPHHPGYRHVSKPLPPRAHLKPTIQNLRPEIQHLLPVSNDCLKSKIKSIHTSEVNRILANYPVNNILHTRPPDINKNEETLPRHIRVQLSRLRSGFSRLLNSYLHKLDENIKNECSLCKSTPHDTVHLFNCPKNPTHLDVLSLWTQPVLAANFLNLDNGIT